MSALLTIGRAVGPYVEGTPHVLAAAPEEVADPVSMHGLLTTGLGVGGSVLVIVPDHLAPAVSRTIATVSSALDGPAVLVHTTSLPPLAADVAVTLAAALVEPMGGVAQVVAVMPLIERQILRYTWLASLGGLRDPAPSVWQHARSTVPGTSWLVTSWPEPTIVHLQGDTELRVPSAGQQVGVAVADTGGQTAWVNTHLAPHLRDVVGVAVPPPPDSAQWWGSKRVTQVVVYPREVDRLAAALRPHLDPGRCSWCRREVGSAICPWCHLPRSGLTRSDIEPERSVVDGVFGGAAPPAPIGPSDVPNPPTEVTR